MTKAEYESTIKEIEESSNQDEPMLEYCLRILKTNHDYIASLEAENAMLGKALDIAGTHIVGHENMCPWNVVNGYVSDECSECIAKDKPIKSECWKAAFIKEATDVSKDM